MSGLAEVLLELGYRVSGSDLKFSPITERLTANGAVVFKGHRAENIAGKPRRGQHHVAWVDGQFFHVLSLDV